MAHERPSLRVRSSTNDVNGKHKDVERDDAKKTPDLEGKKIDLFLGVLLAKKERRDEKSTNKEENINAEPPLNVTQRIR
jgi:hypothetical protein